MLTIKHIDKLAKGASAGPWQRRGGNIYAGNDKVAECPPCQGHRGERNAKYMAAMDPDTARRLIREHGELREALEAMLSDGVWVDGEWVVSDEATAMAEAALKATEEG